MAKPPRKPAAKKRPAPRVDQPVAIAERGESEITLEGVTYRLRPSHTAIRAIEKKTERSLLALVRLGDTGDLSMDALGIIAAELIREGADPTDQLTRNVGAETLSQLIMEDGVLQANSVLTMCLMDAATGGRTVQGEVKAAAA